MTSTLPPVASAANTTADPTDPPYYILVSQAGLPPCPVQPGSSSLFHPIIEYQYADDPPSVLMPSTPGEQVIVLDCTGASLTASRNDDTELVNEGIPMTHDVTAESLSPGLAVAGLKIVDAPGVALNMKDGEPTRNGKMYIIETLVEAPEGAAVEESVEIINAQALVTQFKQRNAALRRVVDAPLSTTDKPS